MTTDNNSDLAMVEREGWERPVMVRLDAADAEGAPGAGGDVSTRTNMLSS